MMNKYIQNQTKLHHKAGKILKELDLVNFLSKFGQVLLAGSFELELMTWQDIDIVVSSELSVENYLNLVNYLFKKENVYSMNLQDFRKSIFAERPQGLYCGVTYLEKPDIFWTIDIWFFKKSNISDFINWVKSGLTKDNRLIILKIKDQLKRTKYGRTISGMEVYKAVLKHRVKNLKEFKKYYLDNKKIIIAQRSLIFI